MASNGSGFESETQFIGRGSVEQPKRWTSPQPSFAGPRDRAHIVYTCMLLAGAGFLFPWSSYVTAIDYFFFLYQQDFHQVSVAIPMTYLVSTWFFTCINVSIVSAVPLHIRIGLGYALFLISLLAIPLIDLLVHSCLLSLHVSYYLTILTVVVVGIGSGIQQSSYYGLAGMLPRRYPQAVMAGESVATTIVSFSRVITKSSTTSERYGAIAFFLVSVLFILGCVVCQQIIRVSPFVKYHIQQCSQRSEEVVEDEEGSDSGDRQGDKLKLLPTYPQQSSLCAKIKAGLQVRWMIMMEIWRLLVAVLGTYCITLLVFPGLVSLVQHCSIADWTPILLVSVFNVTELIAKVAISLPMLHYLTSVVNTYTLLRVVLVPPILLLVSPSPSQPLISSGTLAWAILLVALLGFSSGYFGSLPMIVFSKKVKERNNLELAGTIMTLALLTGLMMGSVLAYGLTPLTDISSYSPCSSNATERFHSCATNSTL